MEEFITCERCGSNACLHEVHDNKDEAWMCFGCGFTTSTQIIPESELFNQVTSTLPELYKELIFFYEGKAWLPSTITVPDKGMVFIDGTSVDDWKWAGALSTEISEDEKDKFPKDQTHKIDFNSIKHFEQRDFMEALEYIGFFKVTD